MIGRRVRCDPPCGGRRRLEVADHPANVFQSLRTRESIAIDALQLLIALPVRGHGIGRTVQRIQNVTEQTIRIRPLQRREPLVAEQRANPGFRGQRLPIAEFRGGETHDGVRESRHELERLAGPPARPVIHAAVGGDLRQSRHGQALVGIERERPLVARFRVANGAHGAQRVAAAHMGKRQIGIERNQRVELLQRVGRPLQAQQAQSQGIDGTQVVRRHDHRPAQQLFGVGEPARLFQAQRRHIEQQGMLEPPGQRPLRQARGLGMVAALRRGKHGIERGPIVFGPRKHRGRGSTLISGFREV